MLAVSLAAEAVSRERYPGICWIGGGGMGRSFSTVVSGSVWQAIEAFAGRLAARRVAAMRVE